MTTPRAPLDLSSVSLPTKAIVVEGISYAWDEASDPPWAGDWTFPPTGWSEASRASWIGTHGHLIAVTREHEATIKAGLAYVESPEFLIAAEAEKIAELVRAREVAQRQIDGAKAWMKAKAEYGAANVRDIPTVEGDVIIMRGMSAKVADAGNAAARQAHDLRLGNAAIPGQPTVSERYDAMADYSAKQREWMVAQCPWPTPDRIREIAEKRPDLWEDMRTARDDMTRARIDHEGKGFAP